MLVNALTGIAKHIVWCLITAIEAIFFAEQDYQYYLNCLLDASESLLRIVCLRLTCPILSAIVMVMKYISKNETYRNEYLAWEGVGA